MHGLVHIFFHVNKSSSSLYTTGLVLTLCACVCVCVCVCEWSSPELAFFFLPAYKSPKMKDAN